MTEHAELLQDTRTTHKASKQRLYLLVGVFTVGLVLMLGLSFFFSQLINDLDKRGSNERARLFIGEDIVRKISLIEKDFYRIVATRSARAREIISTDILENVSALEADLHVLQSGGTVQQTIQLNIDNVDQMVREATYQPHERSAYTMEVIEIAPHLDLIRNNTATLLTLTQAISGNSAHPSQTENDQARRELENFLKSIPPFFHRLSENANRLFYGSNQEIERIEAELANKRSQYQLLEMALMALVIIFTLLFGLTSVRQLNATNSKLNQTLKAIRAARDEAEHMATHDLLCGLPNRVLFESRLEQAIARGKRNGRVGAVAFFDLDGFKSINDQHGHDVGDLLLIAVSHCLRERLRASDTLSRFGGDEFVILIDDLSEASEAGIVMEKLFGCLRTHYRIGQKQFYVTASCGLATFPKDGEDPQTLIKHADTAMYQAKAQGRNRICLYNATMTEEVVTELTMRDELRLALDDNQILVHYQPLIDASSLQIIGAEALLRWQHPHQGLLGSSHFIHIAEQSGQILELGAWVLERSIQDAHPWVELCSGNFRLHVNVSGLQLKQSDFTQRVSTLLQRYNYPAGALELEMTESILIDDAAHASGLFERLRQMGVGLSLDDFGTGYSSLTYLRKMHVSYIKIDRSFIHNIPEDQDDCALVEATLAFGHRLNIPVIAEGVENETQQIWLQERGCQMMQGYYFGKPMSAEDFFRLLAAQEGASNTPHFVAPA